MHDFSWFLNNSLRKIRKFNTCHCKPGKPQKMVCDKCEKKLGKVVTPDPWKSGARNTTEGGGRKLNENKALTANKSRFNPYTAKFEGCRICKQKVRSNWITIDFFITNWAVLNFHRSIKWVHTIASPAHTRRASAPCVERKSLTPRAISSLLLNHRQEKQKQNNVDASPSPSYTICTIASCFLRQYNQLHLLDSIPNLLSFLFSYCTFSPLDIF